MGSVEMVTVERPLISRRALHVAGRSGGEDADTRRAAGIMRPDLDARTDWVR